MRLSEAELSELMSGSWVTCRTPTRDLFSEEEIVLAEEHEFPPPRPIVETGQRYGSGGWRGGAHPEEDASERAPDHL